MSWSCLGPFFLLTSWVCRCCQFWCSPLACIAHIQADTWSGLSSLIVCQLVIIRFKAWGLPQLPFYNTSCISFLISYCTNVQYQNFSEFQFCKYACLLWLSEDGREQSPLRELSHASLSIGLKSRALCVFVFWLFQKSSTVAGSAWIRKDTIVPVSVPPAMELEVSLVPSS